MTSRERFFAALKGEKPDRTPLAHVSALTSVQLQEVTGCAMPQVHYDAEKMVSLLVENHKTLGFDAVTFIINYFNEPAALGCRMDWGNERRLPMYLSHPWQHPEDAFIPPDLLDREPIATCLKAIRIAHKRYGKEIAVLGKIMGPFSMVQVMHGPEKTMTDLIEEPELIKHFLDVAAQILIRHAQAQFAEGADAVAIGEGGAGSNMLSPKMHEEFLLAIHQRLIKSFAGPAIMHICGDITPRLHLLTRTGITCFNFDWAIEPKTMKEAASGKFKIMGNINTADLLRAKPEEIERQVMENLEAGIDIISPGCAVSPECPNENLRAIYEVIIRWHKGNMV